VPFHHAFHFVHHALVRVLFDALGLTASGTAEWRELRRVDDSGRSSILSALAGLLANASSGPFAAWLLV